MRGCPHGRRAQTGAPTDPSRTNQGVKTRRGEPGPQHRPADRRGRRELGIYDSTLGNWVRQDRIDRGEAVLSPSSTIRPPRHPRGLAAARRPRPAAAAVASEYRRLPHLVGIHRCILLGEYAKHDTGVGEARNRTRRAVERTVPFGLVVHSLVVVWYHLAGHHPSAAKQRGTAHPGTAPSLIPRSGTCSPHCGVA